MTFLLLLAGLGIDLLSAPAATLEESLDAPGLVWSTGGAIGGAPWFYQTATTHDGVDAAECGGLTNAYSESWLQTTVTGRVAVLFWWKSASPGGSDFGFWFRTNDTYVEGIYGNVDWRQTMVSFAEGTNTLKWSSHLAGSNPIAPIATNWLDQVVVTNIAGLKPTFLAQPQTAMIVPENYSIQSNLQVRAIGDIPMSYQWQRNGTNLSEGWPFYGVATPSFRFYANTAADAGDYRVVLSNAWGMATSQVCSVSVVPSKPGFYPFQPVDVVLAPGAYHSFNYVIILGTSPFKLQWFKDGNPIPNGRITSATLADVGGYSLVATNAYGAATSRVAQVTVSTDLPTIVSQPYPESVEAQPGGYASFSVQASGPEQFFYSWRKVGDDAELENWNWISFDSADPTNTGFYYVIVSNNNGSVTSRVSVLAVAPVTALGLAVDAPQLAVTNESNGLGWAPDVNGTNAHDSLCAARSPELYFGSSAFSTVVTGPTNISFWWRISAAPQVFLDIAVDGGVSNTISGETTWQQQSLSVPAGEHTLTWTYRKETGDVAGANAAWVDQFTFGSTNSSGGNTNEITTFTTSGNIPHWYLQATNTHDGLSAWQSGAIAADETNRLNASVTGPGTLSFWWMVYSEENYDFLDFRLDGNLITNLSGAVAWQSNSFSLTAGSHSLEWSYRKDGSASEGMDAGWVDEVQFVPAPTEVIITNFTTGGAANWYSQTTNVHTPPEAWQSGAVGDSQLTWLQTTVTGPGTVSFWWAVTSESCCDPLEFQVDGSTQTNIAGSGAWQRQSWPLGSGTHTLKWLYSKDGSVATGFDAGWVDDVVFTPLVGGSTTNPPVIVTNPVSQVVAEYSQVLFSVVATGTPPLFYQWYYYGNPIADATNDSYFIMFAERSYQGPYHVVVRNSAGQATSNPAELEVLMRPIISSINPWSQSVMVGSSAEFYASVSATRPITFQWYRDGVLLPGATNINIVITNVTAGDAGSYRLAATNAYGGALSGTAQMTVITRPVILSWPSPITRAVGQSASFSITATGAPPLFYQWRKAGADIAGANGTSYSIPSVTANDAATYSVVITNSYGSTNAAANLSVVVPPYLLQGPSSQTVLAGGSIYLQAIAGGTPTLNYRWRRFGTNLPGATLSTLRLVPANTNQAGTYDVVVSSSHGSVTSAPATVVVNPLPAGYSPTAQDTNFATSLGADDWVGASAALPDGRWLIGGAFKTVHGVPRRAIARLNADGTVDPTFTSPLPPVSSFVEDLVVQSDGRIVIGGLFYTTNGCTNLARLNTDGSLDTNFVAQVGSTSGNMNGVLCLALASQGRIVVGGRFVTINGVHRSLLGMVHANGSLDTSFVPPEIYQVNLAAAVASVVVQPDDMVIYGTKEEVVGAPYAHRSIYRLLANGQPDAGFVSPDIVTVGGLMYGGNSTYAMALQPNGKLVCALESRVVRLLANGSLDTNFAICQLNFRYDGGQGHSFVLLGGDASHDASILIGGHFTALNGTNHNSLALLDPNGTTMASYSPGTGGDYEYVNTLAMASDGRLLVGGLFGSLGGVPRLNLGFYSAPGTIDPMAYPGKGALGNYYGVSCIATMPDGRIVLGGDFTNVNGTAVSGVARLNADASLDPTFNVGTGPDHRVAALALQADGKVIIGGVFSNVASQARMKLARLNTDGSVDTNFNPVLGDAFVEVDALAVQPNGRIVVGGFFRSVNGTAITNLARLHPDGSLDTTFAIGSGPDNGVLALAIRPDGAVAVGGWFQNVNGQYAPGLALLDASGARLPLSSYPAQRTTKLVSAADGAIYAGTASGSVGSPTLWQINVDGTIAAFVNTGGAWYSMDAIALAVQADGRLLALGYSDKSLRRFNRDRVEDPLFPAVSITGAFSLSCQPDGHILAGGNIMTVALTPGGPTVTRHGLVRFDGDSLLQAPSRPVLQLRSTWPPFGFRVLGLPGQTVTFESSETLQGWVPVLTTNLSMEGSVDFTAPDALMRSNRFYRVVAP